VKTQFRTLKRKLKINPSSLLSSGLLAFLLLIYIFTIDVIVSAFGTYPFGEEPEFSLIQPSKYWLLNLITLLCLALTIVPVSRWLHRGVNDLIFSQDESLYLLPSRVNQQLLEMTNPQVTMPRVVETIGMALHLPYVVLESGSEAVQRFTFGSPSDQITIHEIPIHYLNAPLGKLLVSNGSLSDGVYSVLQECAQQIGIALYVAKLTDVLQTSRERIVIAREEERRRIRNDLHDGLAPSLSSFQLQLGAIRKLITQNPKQAERMVIELSAELRNATAEIRQLVYDLRPPMLDELGLVKALSNIRLTGSSLQLEVRAPDPMPELSAAAEVAIYRIATEAVHNVIKHADATICTIGITIEAETLTLTITDNGQGIPAEHHNGIGTQSMRERAAELGGTLAVQSADPNGTRIEVRLPWKDDHG
jgi:two-component system NarL family sensor kinase